MDLSFSFFFTSILLGIGLAMDAFSVSLANGLNEPCMKKRRIFGIAGVFSFFQFAMPMIGWICIHYILEIFNVFEIFIPYIALILLVFIGIIYLLETLSVIIQVGYFKLTKGKRLFKMSPIHHHFELSNWSENKIVLVFTFVTFLSCTFTTIVYYLFKA